MRSHSMVFNASSSSDCKPSLRCKTVKLEGGLALLCQSFRSVSMELAFLPPYSTAAPRFQCMLLGALAGTSQFRNKSKIESCSPGAVCSCLEKGGNRRAWGCQGRRSSGGVAGSGVLNPAALSGSTWGGHLVLTKSSHPLPSGRASP